MALWFEAVRVAEDLADIVAGIGPNENCNSLSRLAVHRDITGDDAGLQTKEMETVRRLAPLFGKDTRRVRQASGVVTQRRLGAMTVSR